MKTLKITVTNKEQEEALQSFLHSQNIPYREDVPEPFEVTELASAGASQEKSQVSGNKDAWRFGT